MRSSGRREQHQDGSCLKTELHNKHMVSFCQNHHSHQIVCHTDMKVSLPSVKSKTAKNSLDS